MKKSLVTVALAMTGLLVLGACGSKDDGAKGSDTPKANTSESSGAAKESTPAGSEGVATNTAPAGGPDKLADTTIKILAPSYADSSEGDWKKIITAFNAKYPNVKVELQIEAWEGFSSKVQAKIQAKDLPDILNDNNFGAATDGLLYPITEVMSEETLKSIEPSLLKNGLGTDGTQWAAPDIATSRLLMYNTDLFKKAGISAAPKTWDEMNEAAKKIAALGDVYGYGMPLGKEEAQAEATVWLWGAGGTWVDGDKLKADTPQAVEAFKQMKKMLDDKLTQPNANAANRAGAWDLFNQGKVGMVVAHSGAAQVVREKFPNIKYDLTGIPSKDGKPVSYGVTDFIVAFNNHDDARKAATKAFLDMMYTDALYTDWYKGTGLLPVTTKTIEKASTEDTQNKQFYDALKIVQFTPAGNPQWSALQSALQTTTGKLASESPEQVLKEIDAQVAAGG